MALNCLDTYCMLPCSNSTLPRNLCRSLHSVIGKGTSLLPAAVPHKHRFHKLRKKTAKVEERKHLSWIVQEEKSVFSSPGGKKRRNTNYTLRGSIHQHNSSVSERLAARVGSHSSKKRGNALSKSEKRHRKKRKPLWNNLHRISRSNYPPIKRQQQ